MTHSIPYESCAYISGDTIESTVSDKMLWRVLLITLLLTPFILQSADAEISCSQIVQFAVGNLNQGPLSKALSCGPRDSKKEFYVLSLAFESGKKCDGVTVWVREFKEVPLKLTNRGTCA